MEIFGTAPQPAGMDAAPRHRQVGHARNSMKEARRGQLIRCLCTRWEYIHKGTTPTETHQSSTIPHTLKNFKSNKSEEKCKWAKDSAEDDKCRGTRQEYNVNGDIVEWYNNYITHRNLIYTEDDYKIEGTIQIGFPQGGSAQQNFG